MSTWQRLRYVCAAPHLPINQLSVHKYPANRKQVEMGVVGVSLCAEEGLCLCKVIRETDGRFHVAFEYESLHPDALLDGKSLQRALESTVLLSRCPAVVVSLLSLDLVANRVVVGHEVFLQRWSPVTAWSTFQAVGTACLLPGSALVLLCCCRPCRTQGTAPHYVVCSRTW